ncbi:MAG TPA: hypothetical protein P5121_31230 [Caldilineaceae bacterium]|nr:hypothetical protein [Caldilineaceae bacterium]
MNANVRSLLSPLHASLEKRSHFRFARGIPFLMIFLAVATFAALNANSNQAWAQGEGTVPGGTIPGGTIPGGTIPSPSLIYLGFKTSDEIEYPDDAHPDFSYKNEDIVALDPTTGLFSIYFDGSVCGLADANLDDFEILPNGNLLFTLRSTFTIPGLGAVDDSDIIEYTPDLSGCGTFAFRVKGADVGLTQGSEDIDGLGIAADGDLLVSTIGTAVVPSATGELQVRDQALIKLDESTGTWSLYFDGEDVGLVTSSEDIRSVWEYPAADAQDDYTIFLTLSGDFAVESINTDEGDKNDVEGCTLLEAGETTVCQFFKFLNGDAVSAGNQLDGLALSYTPVASGLTPITGRDDLENADERAVELASDFADFMAALAEGDGEITVDDFIEIVTQTYFPIIHR